MFPDHPLGINIIIAVYEAMSPEQTTIYKLHKFVKEYKQLNLEKENKNFLSKQI